MQSITIPHGQTDSNVLILGHMKISAIFVPPSSPKVKIEVFGSHDGVSFGHMVINGSGPVQFDAHVYYPLVFDDGLFDGIQFFKLVAANPVTADMVFFLALTDA